MGSRPSARRPRRTGGRGMAAALLLLLVSIAALASGPYVKGFAWRYIESYLCVSFGVGDALDRPDLKEAILSTRAVTLTFTVEVLRHRTLWKNKTVARKTLSHTVRYDTLTRQYTLETTVDGERADQRVVDSWEEMQQYMENVRDLRVTSVANIEPSEGGYTVRARALVQTDFVLFIIPWDVETPWVSQTLSTP
jgi:hypothetical protein